LKPVFPIVMLALSAFSASSVIAAERYTEVWNPPEAQAQKSKPRAAAAQMAAKKKRKSATSVKQIADKTPQPQIDTPSVASRAKSATSRVSPKSAEPVIPRKIEPNGQVMRV
jgi:hypothetical protein